MATTLPSLAEQLEGWTNFSEWCVILDLLKCDRIWEKGLYRHFMNFQFKNTYNLESIAARLQLWCDDSYINPATLTRNPVPHPLLVWAGWVHESMVFKNYSFMPCFGGSLFGSGSLLYLLTLDLEVEGLNCLQTKWEAWGSYSYGIVTAWKTAKITFYAIWSLFSYPTTNGRTFLMSDWTQPRETGLNLLLTMHQRDHLIHALLSRQVVCW